jgi:hypothetical protein
MLNACLVLALVVVLDLSQLVGTEDGLVMEESVKGDAVLRPFLTL